MAAPKSKEPRPPIPPELLTTEFNDLTEFIAQLDKTDGVNFLAPLSELSAEQLFEKLKSIESYSLKLGFEEAREMNRGRQLKVFADNGKESAEVLPVNETTGGPGGDTDMTDVGDAQTKQ